MKKSFLLSFIVWFSIGNFAQSPSYVAIDCANRSLVNTYLTKNLNPNVLQPEIIQVTDSTRNPVVHGEVSHNDYASFMPYNASAKPSVAYNLKHEALAGGGVFDVFAVLLPENMTDKSLTIQRANLFSASIMYKRTDGIWYALCSTPRDKYYSSDPTRVDSIRLFEHVLLPPDAIDYALVLASECSLSQQRQYTNIFNMDEILLKARHATDAVTENRFVSDNILYELQADGRSVTALYGEDLEEDFMLPQTVTHEEKTYLVTSVADYAFSNCSRVERVTFPSTIQTLGSDLFFNNRRLQSYVVSEDNPNFKSVDGILYTKDGTHLLGFPAAKTGRFTVPDEVISLSPLAFSHTNLGTLTIPKSVAVLEGRMLSHARIDSLSIGCSLVKSSFCDVAVKAVALVDGVAVMSASAFEGCSALQRLYIASDSLTTISNNAFRNCTALETVVFPDSLAVIERCAFMGCVALQSVQFPKKIKEVHAGAFYGCKKVKQLELPDGLTHLGYKAFDECSALEYVSIGSWMIGTSKKFFCNAFENCKNITRVDINSELVLSWFNNNPNLKEVHLGTNVRRIGCFSDLMLNVPTGAPELADEGDEFVYYDMQDDFYSYEYVKPFENCTSLTRITLPASVTEITGSAFEGCTQLATIDFPNEFYYIGGNAFNNTAWLNQEADGPVYIGKVLYTYKGHIPDNFTFVIPEGILGVSNGAFSGCANLKEVTFPESLTYIGKSAFWDTGIEKVVIPGPVNIRSTAFGLSMKEICILHPDARYDNTSFNCYGGTSELEKLALNTRTVEPIIFYNSYPKLTTLVLGDSVTAIKGRAFSNCENLADITFSKNLTTIEYDPFYKTAWYNNLSEGMNYAGPVFYKWRGSLPEDGVVVLKEGTRGIAGEAFSDWLESYEAPKRMIIPESVVMIGTSGALGTSATEFYMKGSVPPNVYGTWRIPPVKVVYVPVGSKEAYLVHPNWKDFNIVEYDVAGIKRIGKTLFTARHSLPIYNIKGQKVERPKQGEIYIQGGKKYRQVGE